MQKAPSRSFKEIASPLVQINICLHHLTSLVMRANEYTNTFINKCTP